MNNGFVETVVQNGSFVLVCLLAVVGMVMVAYLFEKAARKRTGAQGRILSTRRIAMIGMFSAISGILFCFDFALPIAPSFYKIDFSELPALIAGFAFGPVAGVLVEFLKIVIKLFLKSTGTAFVGELANFLVGCMLVLPASVIYQFRKSKKQAVIGCAAGSLAMTVFGTWFNAVYLLPAFAVLYGMPLESILAMGQAINGNVTDITSFVILLVAPLNIIKGVGISVITMAVYKKLSPIIKYGNAIAQRDVAAQQ
ncbi:MAG: ECF transporter S component [Eubacteriales bacterium]|nr:ECF transporter S component [Eubacteriales bacterium]